MADNKDFFETKMTFDYILNVVCFLKVDEMLFCQAHTYHKQWNTKNQPSPLKQTTCSHPKIGCKY